MVQFSGCLPIIGKCPAHSLYMKPFQNSLIMSPKPQNDRMIYSICFLFPLLKPLPDTDHKKPLSPNSFFQCPDDFLCLASVSLNMLIVTGQSLYIRFLCQKMDSVVAVYLFFFLNLICLIDSTQYPVYTVFADQCIFIFFHYF